MPLYFVYTYNGGTPNPTLVDDAYPGDQNESDVMVQSKNNGRMTFVGDTSCIYLTNMIVTYATGLNNVIFCWSVAICSYNNPNQCCSDINNNYLY